MRAQPAEIVPPRAHCELLHKGVDRLSRRQPLRKIAPRERNSGRDESMAERRHFVARRPPSMAPPRDKRVGTQLVAVGRSGRRERKRSCRTTARVVQPLAHAKGSTMTTRDDTLTDHLRDVLHRREAAPWQDDALALSRRLRQRMDRLFEDFERRRGWLASMPWSDAFVSDIQVIERTRSRTPSRATRSSTPTVSRWTSRATE